MRRKTKSSVDFQALRRTVVSQVRTHHQAFSSTARTICKRSSSTSTTADGLADYIATNLPNLVDRFQTVFRARTGPPCERGLEFLNTGTGKGTRSPGACAGKIQKPGPGGSGKEPARILPGASSSGGSSASLGKATTRSAKIEELRKKIEATGIDRGGEKGSGNASSDGLARMSPAGGRIYGYPERISTGLSRCPGVFSPPIKSTS